VAALDDTQLEFEWPVADAALLVLLLLFGVWVVTLELEVTPTGEVGIEEGGGGKVGALSNKEVLVGAKQAPFEAPTQVAGTLREWGKILFEEGVGDEEEVVRLEATIGGLVATTLLDKTAADSGCKKLRRWSILSVCCLKTRVNTSGNNSNCSWIALNLSSRDVNRSSKTSWRVFKSDTISYTVFWVYNYKRKNKKTHISIVNHKYWTLFVLHLLPWPYRLWYWHYPLIFVGPF
jgi:hypothetical protein